MDPRDAVKGSRYHAILTAITKGKLNRLKDLLVEYDDGRGLVKTVMSFHDDRGIGVIHTAAFEGKINILNYLIDELGIHVDTKDDKGETPMFPAIQDGLLNIVEYLIGKGADPKISNISGYTPLHLAAERGHTRIITLLLSRGVNINATCKMGTPLEIAAGFGQLEAVRILLNHNANPDLLSTVSTPLTSAIVSGLPQSSRCVELLLEAGTDPDGGSRGITPLVAAATRGFTNITRRLIEAGANPDATDSFGLTPLESAALKGYNNTAKILFPVTSRIPEYSDWSLDGVIRHVHSDEAAEQRKLKAKEKFVEANLNGTDAFKKQDYFQALVFFSQARDIDPSDASVLSNRSMCMAHMKDGEGALEDAIACIHLKPEWPKAYYRAGVAFNLLKRYGDARDYFLRGLKLSPDNQELKVAYRGAIEAHLKTMK